MNADGLTFCFDGLWMDSANNIFGGKVPTEIVLLTNLELLDLST
jgi:hypothetical protein